MSTTQTAPSVFGAPPFLHLVSWRKSLSFSSSIFVTCVLSNSTCGLEFTGEYSLALQQFNFSLRRWCVIFKVGPTLLLSQQFMVALRLNCNSFKKLHPASRPAPQTKSAVPHDLHGVLVERTQSTLPPPSFRGASVGTCVGVVTTDPQAAPSALSAMMQLVLSRITSFLAPPMAMFLDTFLQCLPTKFSSTGRHGWVLNTPSRIEHAADLPCHHLLCSAPLRSTPTHSLASW